MNIGKRDRVVKAQWAREGPVTAFGGLALAERLARRAGLWSQARKLLPARTRTASGYDSASVLASLVHGLLSGAQGTHAAEPLRGDEALGRLLGLEDGVPEEATVWRTLGAWGREEGLRALGRLQRLQCRRLIAATPLEAMRVGPWTPVFLDGSWLEVGSATRFEGVKFFDGRARLMLASVWVGPYLAAQGLARQGQGEMDRTLELLEAAWEETIAPAGLGPRVLFLADSLYGNQTALAALEAHGQARYVVGGRGLSDLERVASEQPETQWLQTGADRRRGWAQSGLCVHTFQARDWDKPRTAVTRRFRREGELLWRYASVLTNFEPGDERLTRWARSRKLGGFARAVWALYDRKQAMENQFKDALSDLGLHHPPCRELARNEAFYAAAALALNLAAGVRRIGLRGEDGRMRLWRLRREFFAIPARAACHARRAQAFLYSTSNRLRTAFDAAMARLACC